MSRVHLPAVLLGSLIVLVLLVTPVLAQTGPYPLSGAITCDRSVTSPGSTVSCTADGYEPGSVVDVLATGSAADRAGTSSFAAGTWEYTTTATADQDGLVTAAIQVPSDAVGPASVSFTGTAPDGTDRTLRSIGAFTVVAPPADGEGADDPAPVVEDDDGVVGQVLSSTGGPFVLGGIAVLALTAIGALLLRIGGRNRVRG